MKRILLSLSILALALGGAVVWVLYPTYRQPPKPDFPAPKDAAEARRQDLAYLRTVVGYDRSYTPAGRVEFERRFATLEKQAAALDPVAFDLGVSWAVAAADNAHSNTRGVARGRGAPALPIRVLWFRDGLFVVKADPSAADLVGAEVVAIEGRAPEAAARALHRYVGGPTQFSHQFTPFLIATPRALHAAGLAGLADRTGFTFEKDGRRFDRVLREGASQAVPPDSDDVRAARDLSPVRWPGDSATWVHAMGEAIPPPYLKQPDRWYWSMPLARPQALYIQVNKTRDQKGQQPLPDFLDGVLAEVTRDKPRAVIVDLRFNAGGDYGLTAEFTRELPRRLLKDGGKLFVITGPGTFSAGIITAVRLEAFSEGEAVIVGEGVGDRLRYWGEGKRVSLPNSRLVLRYSAGYHDHEARCPVTEIRSCYWIDYFYPSVWPRMAPELPARPSFAEWRAGRDVALEQIAASLGATGLSPASPARP